MNSTAITVAHRLLRLHLGNLGHFLQFQHQVWYLDVFFRLVLYRHFENDILLMLWYWFPANSLDERAESRSILVESSKAIQS